MVTIIGVGKSITVGGNYTTEQLLAAGKYGHVYSGIDWSKLIARTGNEKRIGFYPIRFDRYLFPDEIIKVVTEEISFLAAPRWEDVLFFGKAFAGKFLDDCNVFLHDPIQQEFNVNLSKKSHYLVLSGSCLSASETNSGRPFHKDCIFWFVAE